MSPLRSRTHWIFDLDGTLTLAIHDFDAMRRELGLPAGEPILEAMARLPDAERAAVDRRLEEIELELAHRAEPQPGAAELLAELAGRGFELGILTRNSGRNARATLIAAGLGSFFEPHLVISRDGCAPKPDPDGIHRLLGHWQAPPERAVMVGDYLFDLVAGRSAGAATVYLDTSGTFEFGEHADVQVRGLEDLRALLP